MAVIIIGIEPKMTQWPHDKVQAHLSINNFQWKSETAEKTGISSRALMFDWIVNKGGKAFVIAANGHKIPVLGANSPSGGYIRCAENGEWKDNLLDVDSFIA